MSEFVCDLVEVTFVAHSTRVPEDRWSVCMTLNGSCLPF
jgi:hypothetical protein